MADLTGSPSIRCRWDASPAEGPTTPSPARQRRRRGRLATIALALAAPCVGAPPPRPTRSPHARHARQRHPAADRCRRPAPLTRRHDHRLRGHRPRRREQRVSRHDLARGPRRLFPAAPPDGRHEARRRPALVARRHAPGLHFEPQRRDHAALRHAGERRRGAAPDGAERRRHPGGLVARRRHHRLRCARARRRLRRKRRQAPRAAQVHPAALQVRAHRLDRRPAGAPLHRAGRRFRCSAPGHDRRVPGRGAGLVARRRHPGLRLGAPGRLGHHAGDRSLPDRRVRRRRRTAAPDARRRHGRAALVVARLRAPRRAALPGRLRRPAAHAGGRGRRRKRRPDPVDRAARPQLQHLSQPARAPLGWREPRLRRRGPRQRPPLPGARRRLGGARAAGRGRARGDRLRPGRRAPRARRHRAHHGLRAVRPRGPRRDAPPDPRRRRLRRRPRARRAPSASRRSRPTAPRSRPGSSSRPAPKAA